LSASGSEKSPRVVRRDPAARPLPLRSRLRGARLEARRDVGLAEHGVDGELVDADPQLGLLQAQTPVVGRRPSRSQGTRAGRRSGPRDGQAYCRRSLCQVRPPSRTGDRGGRAPSSRERPKRSWSPAPPARSSPRPRSLARVVRAPSWSSGGRAAFLGAAPCARPGSPLSRTSASRRLVDGVENRSDAASAGANRWRRPMEPRDRRAPRAGSAAAGPLASGAPSVATPCAVSGPPRTGAGTARCAPIILEEVPDSPSAGSPDSLVRSWPRPHATARREIHAHVDCVPARLDHELTGAPGPY